MCDTPEYTELKRVLTPNDIERIIDQLRYPNRTTHFYALLTTYLFKEHQFKETILVCLVKRVLIGPPHPWGIRLVFYELMHNKEYRFWDEPMVIKHIRVFDALCE